MKIEESMKHRQTNSFEKITSFSKWHIFFFLFFLVVLHLFAQDRSFYNAKQLAQLTETFS